MFHEILSSNALEDGVILSILLLIIKEKIYAILDSQQSYRILFTWTIPWQLTWPRSRFIKIKICWHGEPLDIEEMMADISNRGAPRLKYKISRAFLSTLHA